MELLQRSKNNLDFRITFLGKKSRDDFTLALSSKTFEVESIRKEEKWFSSLTFTGFFFISRNTSLKYLSREGFENMKLIICF